MKLLELEDNQFSSPFNGDWFISGRDVLCVNALILSFRLLLTEIGSYLNAYQQAKDRFGRFRLLLTEIGSYRKTEDPSEDLDKGFRLLLTEIGSYLKKGSGVSIPSLFSSPFNGDWFISQLIDAGGMVKWASFRLLLTEIGSYH